jgi:glycosyltransferase involved in cell wall biosynthesis
MKGKSGGPVAFVSVVDVTVQASSSLPGPGVIASGGEARLREVLFALPKSTHVEVITTPTGASVLDHSQPNLLKFRTIFSLETRKGGAVGTGLDWTVRSLCALGSVLMDGRRRESVVYTASNLLPDVFVGALLRGLKLRSRWVAVFHHIVTPGESAGSSIERFISRAAGQLALVLCSSLADLVICVNSEVEGRFLELGTPARRLAQNGNAVDPATLLQGQTHRLGGPHDVTFVGRLSEQKGVLELISIWKSVVVKMPDARLYIAGPEDTLTTDEVKRFAQDCGVEYSVKVLGKLSRADLTALIQSSSLSVTASYAEGWSHSTMESLAIGTPVIAWELPSLKSVYGNGITLIPVGDRGGFSRAVVRLLSDETLRTKMVDSGRAAVSRYMSWEPVRDKEWRLILQTGEQPV